LHPEESAKEMKKALLYLLLAVGILIAGLLLGGALVGFITGLIDGYRDNHPGTTNPEHVMYYVMGVSFVLICVVLQLVFLRRGFASYSRGLIPQGQLWKLIVLTMMVMSGMAMIYLTIHNPIAETASTLMGEPDKENWLLHLWLYGHPWCSIPLYALLEATGDLVLFGGVLRALLEWKHRPMLVIGISTLVMGGVFWLFAENPLLICLSMVMFMIEGWIYECTRSVIPLACGDAFFWVVAFLLMGKELSSWYYLGGFVLILPSLFYLIKVTDLFKPID